jgi:hypothetical protein
MANERNIAALDAFLRQVEGVGSTRKTAEYLARQGVLAPKSLSQEEAGDLRNLRTNTRDRVHQNDDLQFILELERIARGGP